MTGFDDINYGPVESFRTFLKITDGNLGWTIALGCSSLGIKTLMDYISYKHFRKDIRKGKAYARQTQIVYLDTNVTIDLIEWNYTSDTFGGL